MNKISNFYRISASKKGYSKSLKIKKNIKISLITFTVAYIITIFLWPSFDLEKKKLFEYKKDGKNLSKNFTLQGVDELEQPFYLHAKKYEIIGNDKKKLFFVKPKAEINLKKGKWVSLNANTGIFDMEKKTLELIDEVLVLHSDGSQIDTNNAVIDLKNGKFYGNSKLFGKGDTITFNSEGFEIEEKGNFFSLFGKSKIRIKK